MFLICSSRHIVTKILDQLVDKTYRTFQRFVEQLHTLNRILVVASGNTVSHHKRSHFTKAC